MQLGMNFDIVRSESSIVHAFPFNSEKKRGGVAVKLVIIFGIFDGIYAVFEMKYLLFLFAYLCVFCSRILKFIYIGKELLKLC